MKSFFYLFFLVCVREVGGGGRGCGCGTVTEYWNFMSIFTGA